MWNPNIQESCSSELAQLNQANMTLASLNDPAKLCSSDMVRDLICSSTLKNSVQFLTWGSQFQNTVKHWCDWLSTDHMTVIMISCHGAVATVTGYCLQLHSHSFKGSETCFISWLLALIDEILHENPSSAEAALVVAVCISVVCFMLVCTWQRSEMSHSPDSQKSLSYTTKGGCSVNEWMNEATFINSSCQV